MKLNGKLYFYYFGVKTIPDRALELFESTNQVIRISDNQFSKWLDNFANRNKMTLGLVDVWTRTFYPLHPVRQRLNAAIAIIECHDDLIKKIDKRSKSVLLQRIRIFIQVFYFFVIFLSSLITLSVVALYYKTFKKENNILSE